MEILGKGMTGKRERPVRVVQFGEGNFLRAFADYMIDIANQRGIFDGDIVIVKPRESGGLEDFHRQGCQYTVSLRGIVDGEAQILNRQISSVADAVNPYAEYDRYRELAEIDTLRFVVSNTTEAGIVFDSKDRFELEPPGTFPGKLTKFLYHRYEAFRGDRDKGLVMLPVELIDDNGSMLKKCVMQFIRHWKLGEDFRAWVDENCVFASTLVDRIVTGFPGESQQEEWEALGYEDRLLVTAEPYALWVIESPVDISGEFPLEGLSSGECTSSAKCASSMPGVMPQVIFTADQRPYKQRKVRILNGAHTSFALASFLCGNDTVKESMEDGDVRDFMERTIFDEVIPTLALPEEELKEFAGAVIGRFENPYVKHALLSISLNSVSKWRARCLPSLLGYVERFGRLPKRLAFSLAALMAFYCGIENTKSVEGADSAEGMRPMEGGRSKKAEFSGAERTDREIRDGALIGCRSGQEYRIMDDRMVLEFFRDSSYKDSRSLAAAFLGREDFFGQDLNRTEGLTDAVSGFLEDIRENGMRAALCRIS